MKGILLVNLGSPDSPEKSDVKNYLGEFLMDPRVIDVPYLLRLFLVKGIILNTRPSKSAHAYSKIWTKEGSPLIVISEKLKSSLAEMLDMPVSLGMRYGSLTIDKGLKELQSKGVTETLVIPLYPQFAMSTTETVVEKVKEVRPKSMKIDVLPPFYNDNLYLDALSNSLKKAVESTEKAHVLFSYHGVPERHIHKSDITKSHCVIDSKCCSTPSKAHEFCYRHQCLNTTKGVVGRLNLKEENYTSAFQSRLGKDKWLQPYTSEVLKEFPARGIKNLIVVAPSFVSDCLETLEELEMENREVFMNAGGENYTFVPCLNDSINFVESLKSWSEKWSQENIRTYSI